MAVPTRMSRQELYDKVWSTPVRTLAKELGLSDVGLKKTCKRHDIPTPGLGHWAKVAHGHHVSKTPLPSRKAGQGDVIVFHEHANQPWHVHAHPDPALIERERDAEHRVVVARSGDYVHHLVRFTDETLRSRTGDGWLQAPHGCVDVRTSRAQLSRALRIMEALLTASESRGWRVAAEFLLSRHKRFGNFWHPKLGWLREAPKEPTAETGVIIRGQVVAFSIVELSMAAPPTPAEIRDWRRMYPYGSGGPGPRQVPNGELRLEIASSPWFSTRRRFHDLPKKPLEDQLNGVIAAFVRVAAGLREVELKDALERRRELLAARKARDAELRRKELEQKIRRLETGMERWQWERHAREFLDVVKAEGATRNISHEDFTSWLRWAEEYIHQRGLEGFFDPWRRPCEF
jgi:hypothetical protein